MKYLLPIDGLRELMLKSLLVQILGDIGKTFGHSEEIFMKIRDEEPLKMVRSPDRNIEDNRNFKLVSSGEKVNKYLHLTDVTMKTLNDEVYDPMFLRRNSPHILQDGEFRVTPCYRKTEITMTIKYFNDDKVNLERRVDQILLNLHGTQGKYIHDVDVRYPLGARLSALAIEIFNKKFADIPDTEKIAFSDYLVSIAGKRIKPYVNETRKNGFGIGIREQQRSIVGILETNLDTVPIEEEDNNCSIEFEYNVTVEHPYGFIVEQPILVNNRLLDKKFLKLVKKQPKPDHNFGTFFYTNLVGSVPTPSQLEIGTTTRYIIPEYDNKVGEDSNGYYQRIMTRLVMVGEDGKIHLNIRNISKKQSVGFELKKEIIDLMLGVEREYVTKYGRSIFYFGLWEDESISYSETLTLDEHGILTNIKPCDKTKVYRISLYVNMNFHVLRPEDKKRLTKYLRQDELNLSRRTESHVEVLEHLYKTKVGVFSPYEIRKKYLSTLNLLMLSYNISPEEYRKITSIGYNRDDVIFAYADPEYQQGLVLQLFHTDVILEKQLDLKE